MKPLSSNDIRSSFLNFFRDHHHEVIEGATVVPKDDPSLLFINAGMAPLKPYFLGHKTPKNPRMANVQPCIRTKDIADVGDRHHLTMFEMLGSWSIGDYFKDKACSLAYELLVNVLGFDVNRLYATCYAGNKDLNLPPDEESYHAWERCGIPSDRIVMLGEDNFWSAGDTGPCGPCTEVFFDCGDAYGEAYKPGGHFDSERRYIEIWNAGVFMEFNRTAAGKYEPLPFKSVDTGSGLERMAMVMNGHDSVYETDLFVPLMSLSRQAFPKLGETDYRIISDHMRAASFILSAGVTLSNEGQGYVPRRLLRKCIASAFRSGNDPRRLLDVYDEVVTLLSAAYPYLERTQDHMRASFRQEVDEFEPVIKNGIKMFNAQIKGLKNDTVSGEVAFDLVSTHGLPFEVIASLAQAQGLAVDQAGYDEHFKKHQETSRVLSGAQKFHGDEASVLAQAVAGMPATNYIGYNQLAAEAKVLKLVGAAGEVASLKKGEEGYVICDQTPFYAESGGQVADRGLLVTASGRAALQDCQKQGDVFVHRVLIQEGQVEPGASCQLEVDSAARQAVQHHHSATHLLHAALRQHLGPQVVQKGSLVEPQRLRFDFQHPKALTSEEIKQVEATVNEWVWAHIPADVAEMPYDDALASGAMALFGENYGDTVRVVKFGAASTELCGGCHVANTGEIGMFVIVTEGSVAKGVRRIEAITGSEALHYIQDQRQIVRQASEFLGVKPDGVLESLQKMRKQLKAAQKAGSRRSAEGDAAFGLRHEGDAAGYKFLVATSELPRGDLTTAVTNAMAKEKRDLVVVLQGGEKLSMVVFVAKEHAKAIDAKRVLTALLTPFGGRGGGKPHFAQGGFESAESLGDLTKRVAQDLPAVLG